jgi:hypothetical protein
MDDNYARERGLTPNRAHAELPLPEARRPGRITPAPFEVDVQVRDQFSKPFHLDHFFGDVAGCLAGSTPDTTDIEFSSGYVICYRNGFPVAILDAEVVMNASSPPEAYRLRISEDDPDYPVVDGLTESTVDVGEGHKILTGTTGVKLRVALALNWAKDLVP